MASTASVSGPDMGASSIEAVLERQEHPMDSRDAKLKDRLPYVRLYHPIEACTQAIAAKSTLVMKMAKDILDLVGPHVDTETQVHMLNLNASLCVAINLSKLTELPSKLYAFCAGFVYCCCRPAFGTVSEFFFSTLPQLGFAALNLLEVVRYFIKDLWEKFPIHSVVLQYVGLGMGISADGYDFLAGCVRRSPAAAISGFLGLTTDGIQLAAALVSALPHFVAPLRITYLILDLVKKSFDLIMEMVNPRSERDHKKLAAKDFEKSLRDWADADGEPTLVPVIVDYQGKHSVVRYEWMKEAPISSAIREADGAV